MAKKAVATKKALTPTGEIESAGTIIYVPLSRIKVNEAIAAREGAPDPDKVMRYAENFIQRRAEGKEHQLSPALVRAEDESSETFELIDGRHRYEAALVATKAAKDDFMLLCRVIPSNDEAALIDGIQSNEFREDPNDFDRAQAIEKLIALGKSQADCAVIFGLSEGSISQIRKVGQLPAKYRKAIEDGDIDRDAAIFIANLEGDETARNEVFEESIRHKDKMTQLESRIDAKRRRAEADERVDDAKQKVEEAAEEAKAKGDERKAVEKSVKELESSASKTKDVDELIALREKQAKLKAEAEALAKSEKEALAAKEKAAKEVEKAKAAKEKVKEETTKKAVTQEDAKNVAKEKGAKVKGGKDVKAPKTKQQFVTQLEALSQDADNPLPTAITGLFGQIEAYLDGDTTVKQLVNAFTLYCKTNEQLAAAKAAKKR